MMFLTVILNILVITRAIRVPTVWPEQEKRLGLKPHQDTYSFNIDNLKPFNNYQEKSNTNKLNNKEFYTPQLEQQTTDVGNVHYFSQYKTRPSGSHGGFVTNNKKSQYPNEKFIVRETDVRYSVPQFIHETSSTVSHANVVPKYNNKLKTYNQNIDQIKAGVEQVDNNHKTSFSQPVAYMNHNANFATSPDGWIPITGQHSPNKVQELNRVYVHHNPEGKHNQNLNRIANRRHSTLNVGRQYKNSDDKQDIEYAINQPLPLHHRVLNKNYRDDKTHEPSNNDDEITQLPAESDNSENANDDLKDNVETRLVADHETPRDVPTKPIYPGEGQWAIPGQKHQPFISNHRFTYLNDDKDEKPEGFETFQNAKPSFDRQYNKFNEKLETFPQKHALGEYIQKENEDNNPEDHQEQNNSDGEEAEEEEDEDGFVPIRTLAQVRKTENEEHLPSDLADARLREVIKDSKIHTVYTEEGYEDIAYDHEGHEKNAEEGEGQQEFNKDAVKVKQKIPKTRKPKSQEVNVLKEFENYEDPTEEKAEASDAEVSASDYGNSNPNMKMKEFSTTKENKTTEIKNMDDSEMEITSEIKIMTQPNNVKTTHKFVKIVPKSKNKFNVNEKKNSTKIVRRRKRFVNDFPKIEVEKDFLDVLNIDKQHISKVMSTEKYPYYNIKNTDALSKNSPLRYAEDMKNIPKKIAGRMTFYEQSRISECPEIPRNVNPIPDRVQKAENKATQDEESEKDEENEGVVDLPDLPRLQNLGDKIDCLKLKLFGENPLDSPIFQETVVGEPESIFEELHSLSNLGKSQHEKVSSPSDKVLSEAAAISESLISQAGNDENENNEKLQDSEDSYYAVDLNEDYEDTDQGYQANVPEIVKQAPNITVSTTKLYNSLPNAEELPVQTLVESNLQVTEKPALEVGPLIASTTTFASKRLPAHIDEKINLIPKHIYDQIDFAENYETTSSATPVYNHPIEITQPDTTVASIQDQILQTTEKVIASTIPITTTFRPKHIYDKIDFPNDTNTTVTATNLNVTTDYVESQKLTQERPDLNQKAIFEDNNNRQPKSFDVVTAPNLSKNNPTKRMDNNETYKENLPENAALRIRRRRRKRPQMPLLHIFDVNRFLPTPLPPLPFYPTTNTVMPKYKTLSEVYYKDEIKPNEQLNVFADVINNIKNSPHEVLHAEGSENFATVEDNTWNASGSPQKDHVKKLKIPPRKIRIKHNDATKTYKNSGDILYVTTSSSTTTTTASPRRRRKNKYKNHKSNAQVYEEYLEAIKENEKDQSSSNSHGEINKSPQKGKPSIAKGPQDSHIAEDISLYNPIINQDLSSGVIPEDVLGLNPPFSVEFPAVYPSVSSHNLYSLTESTTLNNFLVPGMKPPSNHKPLLYSDFRTVKHNRIRRRNNYHRIQKRSPYKPSYSEIRRNKPAQSSSVEEAEKEEIEKEEEEDDYVPKRNRNFHYDVENDRVVYMNKKEDEEQLSEPQIEEEEEAEEEGVEYLTLEPVTPKPKFVVITTERNGPSFLEYVQQLKNNSNYRVILDPTKKPKVDTKSDLKEVESTTAKQVETVIPEFLGIISKLKSNNNYKEIRDKKEKTTTTAAPEEEEEEEDEEEIEEQNINVKNSPGGSQNYDRSQIFDISEYLPQPKTVIDYSKYKTIERAPVSTRHSLSSRYNSEDDDLPLSNKDTTQVSVAETSEDNVKASSTEQETEKVSNTNNNNRRSGYSSSEERVEEDHVRSTTTELPEVTTTPSRRIQTRRRKRPTTTTSKPTTTTTSAATISRKRTRFRSRPTTTTETSLEENYSQTQRIVHRRLPIERYTRQDQKIPANHKAIYTPLVTEEAAKVKPPVIQRKRKVSRFVIPNRIQLPTNSTPESSEELGKPGEIQPRKLEEVQVFKKYDPNKKHGGNYRREFEDPIPQALEVESVPPTAYEIENSKEIKRLSDVVPKPFAFYSDPTLPKSVNQLKEPKIVEDLPSDSEESEVLNNAPEKTNKDYSEEYDDEVKINFKENAQSATKTPVYIVKDPSKRLYYYAPVK